jgi:AcrR family transcriptional regulator
MTKPAYYNLQERKQTILLTAEEVFAQNSFAGASIRLITQRSGVNMAMISYYFGSKEALYDSIFKLRLEEIVKEIDLFEGFDICPAKKLGMYLTAYIKRVVTNQNFHRLLCNELVTIQHPSIITLVAATRERIYQFLLKIIASGIGQGLFKKVDCEIFALNILALVRSVVTDHLISDSTFDKPSGAGFATRIVDYIISIINIETNQQSETKSHV